MNLPIFMLGSLWVNKNTGYTYFKPSKFISTSYEALVKLLSKDLQADKIWLAFMGVVFTMSFLYLAQYLLKKYITFWQEDAFMNKMKQK